MITCAACGAPVPEGARFCPSCGAPQVAAPDERRVVTVLMADLVGFTGLAEDADPEAVKHLVDGCFQRLVDDLRAHGGALDKIVGDQLVATFGARQAHEDDAERAVRTALHMRETIDRYAGEIGVTLALRIGVNTGEVLVGALRAGGDPTVMGDVVNTASRLQTSADPGTVVVGPATYEATRSVIEYEPLGTLEVRGRRDAIEAWRAVSATAPPGRRVRLRSPIPLIGRDTELRALRAVLSQSLERRVAHLVLLTGDAGVGKTRLLVELGAIAHAEHGVTVIGGHCVPYGEANPWAPLAEALRSERGIDPVADAASARAALRAVVAGHPSTIPPDETDRITDALASVLGYDVWPDADPGRVRDEERRALVTYVETLLHAGPLMVALSDVQWAHDDLFELLVALVRQLRRHPFVVVVSARPEALERWPRLPPANFLALHVEPLDEHSTRDLVAHLLPEGVGESLATLLHERSGGNPLFVEELAALLVETAALDRASAQERLQTLPATLHGLVAARLDTLAETDRDVLADFAVVGAQGPTAAALSLSDARVAGDAVPALEESGLLLVDGATFRFKSELIRDVAYQTLARAERARRHAALAEWFATEDVLGLDEVAYHASEAALISRDLPAVDVPSDIADRAVRALSAAAEAAERREHFRTAGRHWQRLADLATDDHARRRALLGCARAAVEGQHDLDEAEQRAEAILGEAAAEGDRASEAAARMILGRVYQGRNDYVRSDTELGRALTIFRGLGDERAAAETMRVQGGNRLFSGELDEAERVFAEARALFRSLGDLRGEAWALQNLAWISFTRTEAEAAEDRLGQSIDLFTRIGDWGGLSWALGLLAWVRFSRGRLWEAEELTLRVSASDDGAGNRWAQSIRGVLLANIALWTGRCGLCVERAVAAERGFVAIGDRWGQFQALAPQVRALGKLGRWEDHAATLARLRATAVALTDPGMVEAPASIAAACLADRGDVAGALAELSPIGHTSGRRGFGAVERTATEALALLQDGRPAEAVTWLGDVYAQTSDDGPRLNVGGTLALALAAQGSLEAAARIIDELAGLAGGTWSDRHRLAIARACVEARRGDRDRAFAALDEAAAISDATDADVDRAVSTVARAVVLGALGIGAPGWWTALRLAAGTPG